MSSSLRRGNAPERGVVLPESRLPEPCPTFLFDNLARVTVKVGTRQRHQFAFEPIFLSILGIFYLLQGIVCAAI